MTNTTVRCDTANHAKNYNTQRKANLTRLQVLVTFSFFFFEHSRTPSGKKRVTGVQAVTAYEGQSIGCRW